MSIQTRVEKHIIKATNAYYSMLLDFCHKSKNLYNHGNFLVRQAFTRQGNRKWVRYAELDKLLKADEEYSDYKEMPTAQSVQQTLKLLDGNWKSFFASIKDWGKNKDKYLGRPKLPKYLKKDSNFLLILTNQNCKIREGIIQFPKAFNGFTITPRFVKKENFVSFQQIRFIPKRNRLIVELIYKINALEKKVDNQRYIGIDIGVDNLVTVCNNVGEQAFIINGRPLKSINQYYNKQISHYREITKRMNNSDYSKRMDRMTEKRNLKIEDYLHKASRYVIDYCLKHKIHTVVIGKNKEWKQNVKLSKRVNQQFVQIPFVRLIEMIKYKAEEKGIAVVTTEESYTSGTSFIDNEEPVKENYNKARRVYRGMFISNKGIVINADLNGAYQILKKVVPIKWDRGCVLHPIVVNVL